jgi:ubiquinone/menaquinone biosynthesis C-methylase UbiE
MHAVTPPKDPLTEPGAWNAVAAEYDQAWFSRLPSLTDAAIELLSPEHEDTVVDVACGPGMLAIRLAPRVRRVVAVDFAEVMLQLVRGHVMRSHLPNVETHVMDGQELDFSECSFDAAVSLFGVFLFADRRRGLAEMFRVVAPGGRVVVSSWAPADENSLLGAGMAAIRAALPDLEQPDGPLPMQTVEACAEELEAVGFEAVATHRFKQAVRFESVADYWEAFSRASVLVATLREKVGPDAWAEASKRVLESLSTSLGSGAFELDCAAILSYGERPLSAA